MENLACPACGHLNPRTARLCAGCGAPLVIAEAARGRKSETMFGLPSPLQSMESVPEAPPVASDGGAPSGRPEDVRAGDGGAGHDAAGDDAAGDDAAGDDAAPSPAEAKTVFGMPSPFAPNRSAHAPVTTPEAYDETVDASAHSLLTSGAFPVPSDPGAAAGAEGGVAGDGLTATVFGMPSPLVKSTREPAAPAAEPKATSAPVAADSDGASAVGAGGASTSTVFGMPSPLARAAPASAHEPASATGAGSQPPPDDVSEARTVFGMPSPLARPTSDPKPPAAEVPVAPASGAAEGEARTLFGLPSPLLPASGGAPDVTATSAAVDEPEPPPTAALAPEQSVDAEAATLFGSPSPMKAPQGAAVEAASGQHDAVPRDAAHPETRAIQGLPDERSGAAQGGQAPGATGTLFGVPRPSPTDTAIPGARGSISAAEAEEGRTLLGSPGPAALASLPPRRRAPEPVPSAPEPAPTVRDISDAPAGGVAAARPTPAPAVTPDPRRAMGDASRDGGPPTGTGAPEARPAAQPAAAAADAAPQAVGRTQMLYFAARFSASLEEDEEKRARVRNRNAILAFLGLALVAGTLLWFFAREKAALTADVIGSVEVRRVDGAYRVSATIRTSEPAVVEYPGGSVEVEGDTAVRFDIGEADLEVGTNRVQLNARPQEGEGRPTRLDFEVPVLFRFSSPPMTPPKPGVPVKLELRVAPGWTPTLEGGKVLDGDAPGHHRVELDPTPLLAVLDRLDGDSGTLSFRLNLSNAQGEAHTFRESVVLPIPATPVALWSPPHRWATAGSRVEIAGRSVAGARVSVGAMTVATDADGVFTATVPLADEGRKTLEVRAQAPGQRPTTVTVEVARLSKREARARRTRLRREARTVAGKTKRAPAYEKMLAEAAALEGRRVALEGTIIEARRAAEVAPEPAAGAPPTNVLQLVTCRGGDRCPVWVETTAALPAGAGDTVKVYGVLAGTHEYTGRGGDRISAPRLRADLVVP
jgi:hypothetical protein